jgi:phosphoribosylformylglycinamidine synthase
VEHIVSSKFKQVGDIIVELGVNRCEIGGSEYLSMILNEIQGDAPNIDLEYEARLHTICQEFAANRVVNSMHDISDGGLAVNLIESLNGTRDLGCHIKLNETARLRKDFLSFGESQSRVIISCSIDKLPEVLSISHQHKIDANEIGIITGDRRLKINTYIDIDVQEAVTIYDKSIENKMPIEQN